MVEWNGCELQTLLGQIATYVIGRPEEQQGWSPTVRSYSRMWTAAKLTLRFMCWWISSLPLIVIATDGEILLLLRCESFGLLLARDSVLCGVVDDQEICEDWWSGGGVVRSSIPHRDIRQSYVRSTMRQHTRCCCFVRQ